jgi:hypothetical protein
LSKFSRKFERYFDSFYGFLSALCIRMHQYVEAAALRAWASLPEVRHARTKIAVEGLS